MDLVWGLYIAVPLVTIAVDAVLVYWIYTVHGDVRGARWFVLALASGIPWMATHLGMLLASDPALQETLLILGTKFALVSFVSWGIFASVYARQDFHTHPVGMVVVGIVAADIALPTVIEPIKNFWYEPAVFYIEPISYVALSPRWPGVVVIVTVAALVGYAILGLVRYMLATPQHSGTQLLLLVLGSIPIPLMMMLGGTGVLPAEDLNHAAYGALPFSVLTSIALFRFRLFDVQPVARNAVVQDLRDPVFILDADRRLVDYNRASREIVPDVDERIGQPFSAVHPALSGAVASRTNGGTSDGANRGTNDGANRGTNDGANARDDGIGDGRDGSRQVTLSGDGQQRHYSVNVSRVGTGGESADGEAQWYSVLLRDVTDLERSRWQLATQNDRLDQVASTISHDLRNPINVAQGYADVLEDSLEEADVDPDRRAEIGEYVRKFDESHERMLDIIEDILTIAREGKAVEETEAVSLPSVAGDAWDNVDTGVASLAVDEDVTFQADRSKLLTVFENLFRNAVEHAGEGVTVEVGPTSEGFYVQDDGPGIPPENREQVFEYGYSTGDGGTGLGLSIVRTMAESHGWTVELAADDGGGARFEITLGGEIPTPVEAPRANGAVS